MDLSANGLKKLPKIFKKLINLQEIDLSDNEEMDTFPLMLKFCTKLQKINIDETAIEELPEFLLDLPDLTEIEYYGDYLDEDSEEIFEEINERND